MKKKPFIFLIALLTLTYAGSARASVMYTADWYSGSSPILRVTSVFYSAADISGTALDRTLTTEDNLFQYYIQNISSGSLPVTRFGLTNEDSVSGGMFGPDGWNARAESNAFIWDPVNRDESPVDLDPGETVSVFQLFAVGSWEVYPGFEAYVSDEYGWSGFYHWQNGVDSWTVNGSTLGPVASVPEPGAILLFGSGLIGLGFLPFKNRRESK